MSWCFKIRYRTAVAVLKLWQWTERRNIGRPKQGVGLHRSNGWLKWATSAACATYDGVEGVGKRNSGLRMGIN